MTNALLTSCCLAGSRARVTRQLYTSVGNPQDACNAYTTTVGNGKTKVNGWIPLGCNEGSVVHAHLLAAPDSPSAIEEGSASALQLATGTVPAASEAEPARN